MSFTVVIPARYASTRLPAKPLADIHGKPMIQHVYERALQSGAEQVVVATDDTRILNCVHSFGGRAMLTAQTHESGTERLAEVIQTLALPDEHIVVNVQGDEPFVPPEIITQLAENLAAQQRAPMATLASPIQSMDELKNPNVVKVVMDANQYALYFSRAPIPWDRQAFAGGLDEAAHLALHFRHIGMYAYRAGFVAQYAAWKPSPLEQLESLEQLRVLWHGEKIHVAQALIEPPAGIDTPEDLARARQ